MNYNASEDLRLGYVAIKVNDLESQVSFYHDVLGLNEISYENDMVFLGTKSNKNVLVVLELIEHTIKPTDKTGLDYLVIEFKKSRDIQWLQDRLDSKGQDYRAYIDENWHRLQLLDPEGNRIEFIVSNDACLCDDTVDVFPEDAELVHVNISVADYYESHNFLVDVIGLNPLISNSNTEQFYSVRDEIKLMGINSTSKCSLLKESDLGIDFVSFKLPDTEALIALRDHLEEMQLEFYYNKGKQIVQIFGPSRVSYWFEVQ